MLNQQGACGRDKGIGASRVEVGPRGIIRHAWADGERQSGRRGSQSSAPQSRAHAVVVGIPGSPGWCLEVTCLRKARAAGAKD